MFSEAFNLSWRDFESSTTYVLKELLNDELFTDVTLACEDNKQLRTRKVILGASSTFFKNIFLNNSQQNLVIVLKGVTLENLSSIKRFVYLGQTEVGQDDLEGFMTTAEGLEIKGLVPMAGLMKNYTGGQTKKI